MTPARFKLNRRSFMALASASVAALTVGLAFNWTSARRAWIARKLKAEYHYLDFEPQGVARFIETYEEHLHVIRRNPLKLLLEPIPENVVLSFLASSDFFVHDGNESRVIHFVAVHDPYASPCFNPFIERQG